MSWDIALTKSHLENTGFSFLELCKLFLNSYSHVSLSHN